MNPFFSVYIPVYNGEKYLAEAIESVLGQKYNNFELLIINDGSTDSTASIAELFAKKDSRIRIITQKNIGLFHTRIKAFEYSQGEYIIALDADDRLKPNALSYIWDIILKYPKIDMVCYGLEYTDFKSMCRQSQYAPKYICDSAIKEFWEQAIVYKQYSSQCTKAIKRQLVQNNDMLKELPRFSIGEDYVHTLNYLLNLHSVYISNMVLYEYRYTFEGMTKLFKSSIVDDFIIISQFEKKIIPSILFRKCIQCKIKSIAKILLYYPSCVNGKNGKEEYMLALEKIRNNLDLCKIIRTANFFNTGFIYFFPLILFRHKCDMVLFIMKKLIYKIRLFYDYHFI